MNPVFILDDNDTICESDYYRPTEILYSDLGEIHFTNTYSGRPINHLKWLPVRHNIWNGWYGKTVAEFNSKGIQHEFCRGVLPRKHIL